MLRQLLLLYMCLLVFLIASLPAAAQREIRVRGTILQPDKTTPIPGAGVMKVGSNLGVVSDAEGNFLIDIQPQDTLLIRAVGFKPLLYLPQRLPVSEVRVNIVLQEDSVMLGEVEVSSRPSEKMIQRALRNMKRTEPELAKNPGYLPGFEPPPPPPEEPAVLDNPFSIKIEALYDTFSKEGKQNKKLQELLRQQKNIRRLQEQEKAKREYNSLFKDSTSYR